MEGFDEERFLCFGVDFHKTVDNTCGVGFDHHHGQKRQLVFSGL